MGAARSRDNFCREALGTVRDGFHGGVEDAGVRFFLEFVIRLDWISTCEGDYPVPSPSFSCVGLLTLSLQTAG